MAASWEHYDKEGVYTMVLTTGQKVTGLLTAREGDHIRVKEVEIDHLRNIAAGTGLQRGEVTLDAYLEELDTLQIKREAVLTKTFHGGRHHFENEEAEDRVHVRRSDLDALVDWVDGDPAMDSAPEDSEVEESLERARRVLG